MTSRNTLSKLGALASLSLLAACADSATQPTSLAAPAAVSLARGGISANEKLCQKGGYLTLARADGTTFTTQKECTSYARSGGAFWPPAVIDVVGVVDNGAFNFNVTAANLQPGSTVYVYATGFSYGYGPLVDGSVSLGVGTVCGQGYTNWYASGTTITGATIESVRVTGCP